MHTAELVQQARAGDDDALCALYERYYPRVERIVRLRLGPKLRAVLEVEDVLQEVFLACTLRIEEFSFEYEGALLDWLSTLATRRILKAAEHWSRSKRDPAAIVALVRAEGADDRFSSRIRDVTASITGPATHAVRNERDEVLERALDGLDEKHREVLVLRHWCGLPFTEIAERLDRPTELAARELYRRARAKLAVRLSGWDFEL